MTKKTRWQKCGRKPDKIIKEIRRSCRRQGVDLIERQNGTSHWVGKTGKGIIVVPRGHGELPKGTHRSILKTLAALGLAVLSLIVWLL